MSAQQTTETAQEVPSDSGILRKTVDSAVSLVATSYDTVKNSNDILKSGLEKVEATTSPYTTPALEKLENISGPLVEQLDGKIDSVVIPAVSNASEKVASTVNTVKEYSSEAVNKVKASVNEKILDPTTQQVQRAGETWTALTGTLSKEAASRLEASMERIRQLSANELKDYLHVDLVQYSTDVIVNARTTARPYYELVNQTLTEAVTKASTTALALQLELNARTSSLMLTPERRADLKLKLQAALEAARALSHTSVSFLVLSTKKGAAKGAIALSSIPGQLKEQGLVQSLRAAPTESINFILAAPGFFTQTVEEIKQEEELDIVAAVRQLVAAVTEVFALDKGLSEEGATEGVEVAEARPAEGPSASNDESTP
jgi:hypothetical protein